MLTERLTQAELAAACNLTQAHLSKVLSGKVRLTGRTAQALVSWLKRQELYALNETLLSIDRKIRKASAGRRMQIMQMLKLLDGLLEQ